MYLNGEFTVNIHFAPLAAAAAMLPPVQQALYE
jgi:hypothetical protein